MERTSARVAVAVVALALACGNSPPPPPPLDRVAALVPSVELSGTPTAPATSPPPERVKTASTRRVASPPNGAWDGTVRIHRNGFHYGGVDGERIEPNTAPLFPVGTPCRLDVRRLVDEARPERSECHVRLACVGSVLVDDDVRCESADGIDFRVEERFGDCNGGRTLTFDTAARTLTLDESDSYAGPNLESWFLEVAL